jgi:purine-nucleoside phosphorylase
MPVPTPHISSAKKDIAKTVLMPGDPLRSKYIAENFLAARSSLTT